MPPLLWHYCPVLPDLIRNLIVSASLGALIGLQRQWEEQHFHPERKNIAGLRTFTLWSVLGTLSAHLSQVYQPLFYLAGFIVLAVLLSLFVYKKLDSELEGFGLTTALSGLLTYLIGGLIFWQQWKTGIVLSVSLILLLASKRQLREITQRFTADDVKQALQFAAISGVILPLVPNQSFGPYQAFNPYTLWLMVVLVSGLGFGGYVAMRLLGERGGIAVTGLLGGLASSTATTLAMSRQSKNQPDLSRACALAIILACTIMLGRVALITLALSKDVFAACLPGLLVLALPGMVYALWFQFFKNPDHSTVGRTAITNPLSLKIALQFAFLYIIIVFISRAAINGYGQAGLYWTSFFSGLTDLDAITVSTSQMAGKGAITPETSSRAILIGCLANTLLKGGLACFLGSPQLRKPILTTFGITLLLGSAYLLLR